MWNGAQWTGIKQMNPLLTCRCQACLKKGWFLQNKTGVLTVSQDLVHAYTYSRTHSSYLAARFVLLLPKKKKKKKKKFLQVKL
jgi:hypothetical protein